MRALAAVLLLLAHARGAEEEVVAELSWKEWPANRYAYGRLTMVAERPADIEPPPADRGDADRDRILLWTRFPFAQASFRMAAHFEADDKATLWVDRDFDGTLDPEPIAMRPVAGQLHAAVPLALPDRTVTYHVYRYRADPVGVVRVAGAAHREGTVVLEGRLRRVRILDHNGDQRFDQAGTRWALDLDGDGRAATGETGRCADPFRLRDSGYVATALDPVAARVAFRKVTPAPPPKAARWARHRRWPGARRAPRRGAPENLKAAYEQAREDDEESFFSSTWARQKSLRAIGMAGTKRAFQFLLARYTHEKEPRLQRAAVEAMGYVDYVDFEAKVARIARSAREPAVRQAALQALDRMNAPGRAKTCALVLERDRNDAVVEAAAKYLAYVGSKDAFDLLAEAARKLPRVESRYHAYYAYTRYRKADPAPELVLEAARSTDPRLRALGLGDARTLGRPEVPALALEAAKARDLRPELRLSVIEILGARGAPEEIAAVLPLADGAAPAARGRLIDLLRLVRGPGAVEAVLEGLDARPPAVRSVAAEILARIPDPRVGGALADRIRRESHEDALVGLVRAAGEHRIAAAAPAIASAARRHSANDRVQTAALRALGRIGFGHEAVAGFFAQRLRGTRWEDRVVVLDAAAASGDPDAGALLLEHVDHFVWQVRLAAVQGLGVLRVKAAIEPLIERLDKEKNERIKRAVADTLYWTTGRQLFDIADMWRRWWHANKETFEVPKEVPSVAGGGKEGERRTVATFYGVPVVSDRIIFVIDQSGSMGSITSGENRSRRKSSLRRAVDETLKVAGKLPDAAKINVILFESEIHPWKRNLVRLTSKSKKELEAHLRRQEPTGGTNLFDGLEMALLTDGVDAVYLLSDGAPGAGKFISKDDILREVRKINQTRRIAIHCVSIGLESHLLQELAIQNGGTYVER